MTSLLPDSASLTKKAKALMEISNSGRWAFLAIARKLCNLLLSVALDEANFCGIFDWLSESMHAYWDEPAFSMKTQSFLGITTFGFL